MYVMVDIHNCQYVTCVAVGIGVGLHFERSQSSPATAFDTQSSRETTYTLTSPARGVSDGSS